MTYKKGFTLAEILIVLGVIGVVAALTIPTIIANIYGIRYRNQFKKSISTLNQAIRLNKANYEWDLSDAGDAGVKGMHCAYFNETWNPETSHTFCAILEGSALGAIQLQMLPTTSKTDSSEYFIDSETFDGYIEGDFNTFEFSDGSQFSFIGGDNCHLENGKPSDDYCIGFIDVNGRNKPNKEIQCSNNVETTTEPEKQCTVKNQDITDIFPVMFYDTTVKPLTNAAAYVLNTTK